MDSLRALLEQSTGLLAAQKAQLASSLAEFETDRLPVCKSLKKRLRSSLTSTRILWLSSGRWVTV